MPKVAPDAHFQVKRANDFQPEYYTVTLIDPADPDAKPREWLISIDPHSPMFIDRKLPAILWDAWAMGANTAQQDQTT